LSENGLGRDRPLINLRSAPGLAWVLPASIIVLPASLAWQAFAHFSADNDFRTFYETALAWRGVRVSAQFERPNLNPPTFTALIVPLTYLPLPAAFGVWTALGLGSIAASLRAISIVRGLSSTERLVLLGALTGSSAALLTWLQGQVAWLLAYPVTRAWLAAERSSLSAAGWLGVAVAVKPTLAIFVLALPWRVCWRAGSVAMSIVAVFIAVSGWAPWQAWFDLSSRVTNQASPASASLWSLAARIQWGPSWPATIAMLDQGWFIAIGAAAVYLRWRIRQVRGDRRWSIALLFGILMQPLGWIYYLCVGFGFLLKTWPRHWQGMSAAMLVAVPHLWLYRPLVTEPVTAIVLASPYVIAIALLWARLFRCASPSPES
jgi:hypothetical protein